MICIRRYFLAILVLSIFFLFDLTWGNLGAEQQNENNMVKVPAGPFMMGSSGEDMEWAARTFFSGSIEWYQDETPDQAVYLEEFFIDRTEVTVASFAEFTRETGQPVSKYFDNDKFNQPDQPVVGVSWKEAIDYCSWRGKRLPTETEWEKAARGIDGRRYPWGNEPNPLKGNVRGMKDKFRYTAPVGSFSEGQSPYGAQDMAGNVFEWTQDWYEPYPGNDKVSDMFGKKFKVIRGGSWKADMDLARSALRGKAFPDQRSNYVGFRCAKDSSSKEN